MNLLNSIYHQILSGCLLFTLGLGMTNPIAVVPIAGHFQEPTLVDAEMIGYVQRNLPPDIGGVIPSVIMSGNPPVANNDALEVNEDDIATLLVSGETSVLFNDSDDEGDTLTVWATNDENRIPVYAETPIIVGSVKMRLSYIRNNRYPISAFQN